jgi:hypothetical protein
MKLEFKYPCTVNHDDPQRVMVYDTKCKHYEANYAKHLISVFLTIDLSNVRVDDQAPCYRVILKSPLSTRKRLKPNMQEQCTALQTFR